MRIEAMHTSGYIRTTTGANQLLNEQPYATCTMRTYQPELLFFRQRPILYSRKGIAVLSKVCEDLIIDSLLRLCELERGR